MLAHCLAGTRVINLSFHIPGPMAKLWLADLGAEMVKVADVLPVLMDDARAMRGRPFAEDTAEAVIASWR